MTLRTPPLYLGEKKLKVLEKKALTLRQSIIEMLLKAGSGHSAGPLGMADIFAAFYFHILVHNPKKPAWKNRDRLILSNGHICPVRYAAMAEAGYFPKTWLSRLRQFGSPLQGHPEHTRLPGLETTSGPLGSGSSQAVGIAYAGRMDKAAWRVYCVMSDGELDEGQTWEAMLFAGRNHLDNCTFVIDRNRIQIDGPTEQIMPLDPLREKFEAFGLHVEECAGNDIKDFVQAVGRAHTVTSKATVIIANTIPGKGVDFMENDYRWHGAPPNEEQAKEALKQLSTL